MGRLDGQGRARDRRGVGHRRGVRAALRAPRARAWWAPTCRTATRRRPTRTARRARRGGGRARWSPTFAREHGRLDVVVNAAGVAGGGPVHLLDADEWDRVLDVNLKGTFLVCKHALGQHARAGPVDGERGSIVNIASIEGLEGTAGGSAYNASKGGVVLLTKNLAIDYGRIGIRANCICPGFIDTPMFRRGHGPAGDGRGPRALPRRAQAAAASAGPRRSPSAAVPRVRRRLVRHRPRARRRRRLHRRRPPGRRRHARPDVTTNPTNPPFSERSGGPGRPRSFRERWGVRFGQGARGRLVQPPRSVRNQPPAV